VPVPVTPRKPTPYHTSKEQQANKPTVPGKSARIQSPHSQAQIYGPSSSPTTCPTCTTQSRTGPGTPVTRLWITSSARTSASTTPRISSISQAISPRMVHPLCPMLTAPLPRLLVVLSSSGPSPRLLGLSLPLGMMQRLLPARVTTALLLPVISPSRRVVVRMVQEMCVLVLLLRSALWVLWWCCNGTSYILVVCIRGVGNSIFMKWWWIWELMSYGFCMDKLDWSSCYSRLDGHNNGSFMVLVNWLIVLNWSIVSTDSEKQGMKPP